MTDVYARSRHTIGTIWQAACQRAIWSTVSDGPRGPTDREWSLFGTPTPELVVSSFVFVLLVGGTKCGDCLESDICPAPSDPSLEACGGGSQLARALRPPLELSLGAGVWMVQARLACIGPVASFILLAV